ncbi:MAG: hypothetical protein U0636_09290 [Phycisphaerales bacterium]
MNQFLLALRSLAIALVIFLVLAALTARFFGGTLFGKDPVVAFAPLAVGGTEVYLTVKGSKEGPGPVEFALMQRGPSKDQEPVSVVPLVNGNPVISGAWRKVLGPVLTPEGVLRAAVGADRGGSSLDWWLLELRPGEKATATTMSAPDESVFRLLGGR